MARGKIFTNRKQKVDVGEEKAKKSTQVKRKDKKSSKDSDGHPKGGGDYFDPKTGVVFSTRPEDSCIPLMEANITKFLKNQGQLQNPEDHVTVALHVIDYLSGDTPTPNNRPLVSTLPPITQEDLQQQQEDKMATVTSNDVSVTFWQEVTDPKTNHSYYWNPTTNEVSWTLPHNAVLTSEASERSDAIQDPENETLPLIPTTTSETANSGLSNGITSSSQTVNVAKTQASIDKVVLKESVNQESTTVTTANLVDEIIQKIQFLNNENFTDVHAMNITFQTRATDWKQGGLNSDYFLSKLQETEQAISHLVQEKITTKWEAHWDRNTARFYFKNNTNGKSQWEWPSADTFDSEEIANNEGSNTVYNLPADKFPTVQQDTSVMESASTDKVSTIQQDAPVNAIVDNVPSFKVSSVQQKVPVGNNETTPIIKEATLITPPNEQDDMDIDSNSDENQLEESSITTLTTTPNGISIEQSLQVGIQAEKGIEQPTVPMEQPVVPIEHFTDPGYIKQPTGLIGQFTGPIDQPTKEAPVVEMEEDKGKEDTQPVVVGGLYSDIPLPSTLLNEGEEEEEDVDQMILTELEAANQEALLRARLLEKMKNNGPLEGEESALAAEMSWKPPPNNEPVAVTTEVLPSTNNEPFAMATEAPPLDDKPTKQEMSEDKKSRVKSDHKKKHYDSDSDLSDDYRYSRSRRRSRDHHTSSSRRSKKSYKYSDDSDYDDRKYSSSRRRSRSKGRSSKRKKDHRSKKKHYHDSSPSDDDRRRRRYHSSDDERDRKRKHRHHSSDDEDENERVSSKCNVTPPTTTKVIESSQPSSTTVNDAKVSTPSVTQPTTAPPPLEKSFVPARFKPKGKNIEEDNNGQMLSQTQVEMIHNIASATGYPMMYTTAATIDPSQYTAAYAATYYNTTTEQSYVSPDVVTTTTTTNTIEQSVTTTDPVPANNTPTTVINDPVPSVVTNTSPDVVTTNNDTVAVEEKEELLSRQMTVITEQQSVETNTPPNDIPTDGIPVAVAISTTPTNDEVALSTSISEEAPFTSTSEEAPPTITTTANEPSAVQRDVTPPLQDIPSSVSTITQQQSTSGVYHTISAPSTSYPATTGYTDPAQYAAAAYASMAAYNPFYAQMYGGDQTQYAAAMNYYAAYQAAAYGAYYQQTGTPPSTQSNVQKK